VEAFHRDHRPTVLSDALMCVPPTDFPMPGMQQAVALMLSHYAETTNTQAWIRTTSRKVGAIK